jgi:signal transduction histidine kinase
MASAEAPIRPSREGEAWLRRYPDRGLLGGVCVGLARYLGVELALVRVIAAVAVVIGGLGIALYALGWALIPVAPESEGVPRRPGAWRQAVLIVLVVAAALLGLRVSGLHFADWLVWPLVLGVCGLALVWRSTGAPHEQGPGRRIRSPRRLLRRRGRAELPRLLLGTLLVAFAAAAFLHAIGVQHSLGKAIGAVAIIAAVASLLVAPWFVRLGRSLTAERSARIREQERAELAAHLHDSVLQTLALIQKRSGEPREVAGLARRQERELRKWLLGREERAEEGSARSALERVAAEVEELHGVRIEVVVVGERALDAKLEALVLAAREALTNAAKFAGSDHVDLYAELGESGAEVYVRDRGAGFDPDRIPEDRRGVRDSIIGRVERHGGRVRVRSAPNQGTEVELAIGAQGQ